MCCCRLCFSNMQQPKPKPKPALKKTNQNFGAYKVPLKAKPDRQAPPESDRSAASSPVLPTRLQPTSNRSSHYESQLSDRDSSPDVPASRRTFRSTSSKGSRRRRTIPVYNSDSDTSLAVASRASSAATSGVTSAASEHNTDENRESTAGSILGLWDVNRAQEKTAEKENVRERRHRASQEGVQQAEPESPSVEALLRQHLSMSKWKGAVKAVNAVNKMGILVKNRPPSAPAAIKQRHSFESPGDSLAWYRLCLCVAMPLNCWHLCSQLRQVQDWSSVLS